MKATVYHIDTQKIQYEPMNSEMRQSYLSLMTNFSNKDCYEAIRLLSENDCYIPVAEIDIERNKDINTSLEDIFKITNHINEDWSNSKEVHMLTDKSVRSTSMGDIVELNNRYYMVAAFGYKETESDIFKSKKSRTVKP